MGENKKNEDFYIPKFLNSTAIMIIGTAILYFIFSQLSLLVIVPETNIPPLFPAVGLAVAFVLIFGRKALIGIALGSFAYSIGLYISDFDHGTAIGTFAHPILVCLIRPLIACSITFIVSYLIQLWCKNKYPFSNGVDVFYFTLASLIGSVSGLFLGILPAALTSAMTLDKITLTCINWSQSNLLGIILITPLILSWFYKTEEVFKWTVSKKIEGILLIIFTLAITLYVFTTHVNNESIIFFLLIFAATRFGLKIITLITLIVTVISVKCTLLHLGGFGWNGNFLMLQLFLFVNITSVLFLKAILTEKENKEQKLKISEQALNLKKDILQATLENPYDISIFSLDTNLNYLSFNLAHAGFMKKECGADIKIGENHVEFFPKGDRKEEINSIYHSVLEGKIYFVEQKDDEGEYWNIHKSPINNQEGKIIGTTTIVTNITELKLKELQLEKNNLSLNERIKEMDCLYSISEIFRDKTLSKSKKLQACVDIIPKGMQFPEITNCRIQLKEKEFSTANYQQSECFLHQIITVNGEEIGLMEVNYLDLEKKQEENPFLDEEVLLLESLSGIISKALEIKQAEEKLIKSEEKFRSIYENSLDIYFKKDFEGILLEIGPSVEKHLHRSQEFMIGKNVNDFYYDHTDGERFYKIILKEQQINDYEEVFVTPTDELVYFSVNAKLVCDSEGNPLFVEGTKRNISERIQNERQLLVATKKIKESEEKFRSIYENSLDIYFKRDVAGNLLDVSPSVEQYFNLKSEDVIGQNANDFFVNHADGNRFKETILQNKQVNDYEERFVTANGDIVYFSVTAKVIYDSYGEPVYFEGTMRNVNERILNRKKLLEATEKIKESEEKFRSIFENMQDVYYLHNIDGTLLNTTPSVEKYFNVKRDDLIGEKVQKIFANPQYYDELTEITLREGFINDKEVQFLTPAGETIYFSVNSKLINDRDGNPTLVEGTMRNISERIINQKQLLDASEKIKESEEKFRSIYENSLDIYFKKDLNGIILEIGPSVDKHLNHKRESMIGKNIRDYYYDSNDVDLFYETILKEQQIIDYQEQFITATGDSVYLSVNAKLVYNADGTPIYVEGTRRNISERILNEKHLLEASEKIKESEESYRTLFENVQDVFFKTCLRTDTILEVSPSCSAFNGIKREELIGQSILAIYPDTEQLELMTQKLAIELELIDVNNEIIIKGKCYYVTISAKIIFDAEGKPEFLVGALRNVSERRLAEENLKISEEKYRSIFENTQDVYYMHNLDGRIFEVSPAVEKHFKYTTEEMIGKYTGDLYYDPSKQNELREKIIKNGSINDEPVQFVTATGEPLYFSVNCKIIFDKDGTPSHIEGSMRNINDRITNQQKLIIASEKIKESEEKFRSIYENMHDVYFLHELDGTLIDISPSAEKNFPTKRENLIGLNAKSFYYEPARYDELLSKILEDDFLNDQEVPFLISNGEIIYFSISARLIKDSTTNRTLVEGTMRNINDRISNQKQLLDATEKIRESEEKFRSIYENIQDIYFMYHLDGTIIDVSPSAEKIFNLQKEEFVGRNAKNLQTNPARYDELMAKLHNDGFINDQEVQYFTASGETVYFSISAKLTNDYDRNCTVVEGTMRNIDERINNQKQLLKASEKIKESEEKFRSIYENMLDVYFLHGTDGIIIDISPSAETAFQLKKEEFIGVHAQTFQSNPARYDEVMAKIHEYGFVNDEELEFLTSTGESVYYSVNARLTENDKYKCTLVEGTMRNINERIINQKKLLEASEKTKESEENFRSLFDNMQDIYFMHNFDGKIFEVSPAVEKHLKYKREEIIGTYSKDHFYDPSQQLEIRKKLINNGYINDHEIQYVTATGEPLYFSLNSRIKFNQDGTPSHIEGSMRNINERILNHNKLLEATEKIKQSEEEYRSIFESFEDLYFRTSMDGCILNISPSVEKIFKYKREEIIDASSAILYAHPEDRDKVIEALNEKGNITEFETIFKDKENNTLYVSVNAHFGYDSKGNKIYIEGTIRDISERKKNELEIEMANQAIKESEEEFRAIFESFEDVYFRSSLDGCVQNISPSVEKIFKYKREEFIGTVSNILYLYPEDSEKVMASFTEKGYIKDYETIFKDKENKIIYVSLNIRIMYDSNGNATHIEGIIRDISERKKNELEIEMANEIIRESEKKYRTIFESVRDVFFRASAIDNIILDVSPSCSCFGIQPEDVIGKPVEYFYLNPEDRHDVLEKLRQNGEIKNYDAKFSINSKTYTVSINSKVIFDQNNQPEFVMGSFRDVTERIQAEENLKISEAKFRSIYENFEDVYFKTELDGTVIDLSPSFERNFKMPISEGLGKSTLDFYYNSEDRERAIDLLKRNGVLSDFDAQFVDGEGNILFFSVNTRFIRDSYGKAIYFEGTMRNVNERSLMQEEMLAKNRTLEFQNTELEQFAYIASHDLQEPLITVIQCIELLQEGLYDDLDQEKKQYLEFINSSTSRMQQLVKGLLDYSRIGKGRKNSQNDCNEIVANVIADMNVSLKESNAIVEYENLPVIEGYTTEIRQLFQNMISNANKFRKKDQQPKIKITASKDETNWIFSIEDNGIGIKAEDMDKVFVIFKRLHNRSEYQGTGIGLSHCKKIVEHHHGQIWVESKFNEGSTFKWTFPIEQN